MWWNFIGRSHEEVAQAAGLGGLGGGGPGGGGAGRFGRVEGYAGPVYRIPAPALPGVRLKSRGNRETSGFSGAEANAMS